VKGDNSKLSNEYPPHIRKGVSSPLKKRIFSFSGFKNSAKMRPEKVELLVK
jgi:hypothetical protein